MDAAETYDSLADHYHLIFADWEQSIVRQGAVLRAILERECGLSVGSRVLDCVCGIGTQSLGLAALGFQLTGCDLSRRAVERARREASRRNLSIQFFVADMLELNALGRSRFDAVIAMDNSLPHLQSETDLLGAANQIRERLRPGGWLMASLRDYDRLLEKRPAFDGPWFYSDQGSRRIVFQVWDWLDDRRYIFHLYITREIEKRWETFHASGLYRAIRRKELSRVLDEAGFKNVRWLTASESGFYQPIVVAQRQ